MIDNDSFESMKDLIIILLKLDAKFYQKLMNFLRTWRQDKVYFLLPLSEKIANIFSFVKVWNFALVL